MVMVVLKQMMNIENDSDNMRRVMMTIDRMSGKSSKKIIKFVLHLTPSFSYSSSKVLQNKGESTTGEQPKTIKGLSQQNR